MKPSINIIDQNLIKKILTEAKQILAQIGVEIQNQTLQQRLLDCGLTLDANSQRLIFPPDVVEKAIASTPSSFTLYNREGHPHTQLGGDNVHFVPGSSALNILDHRTDQTHPATTPDLAEYVRLADTLPNIAYLATAFSTNDVDTNIADVWRFYVCLTNTTKPIVSGAFTEHGVPLMARMMALFRTDKADLIARPMSIFTVTPSGLFRYGEESCQNLLDCVEWGIPIEIVPVTFMGLTAPVTLVGATVMHVADVLAGLTIIQLLKPGFPLLFGGAPATFHMKATTSPMAAIEALHLGLAYIAVAKSLNLPTQAYMALSDSKFLDAQAGAETFGGALLAALAGINSISGPGMLDFVLTFSLEKLVFDAEMCGQALHFIRKMKILDDLPTLHLARQLLNEQHFLANDHTLTHWPKELYLPTPIIDRLNRDTWQKAGQQTLSQRAKAEVEKYLATYTPIQTDPLLNTELQRLIQTANANNSPLPQIPPPPAKSTQQKTSTPKIPTRRRRK